MKVGSLVECLKGFKKREIAVHEVDPEKGSIYTVRFIWQEDGKTYIRLVEIINKPYSYSNGFGECGFDIQSFREVQPPMDVSALLGDILKVPNQH